MAFVFLHVRPNQLLPTLLVGSIRRHLPDAEIIQCADQAMSAVSDVTRIDRISGNTRNLMTFRFSGFSSFSLKRAAAYIDTYMLMIRPFDCDELLGDSDVAVCKRSFKRQAMMNTSFVGMDLSEYENKPLAEVYPYLACFTVVRGHAFWTSCRDELKKIPQKFEYWYVNQEAIRNIIERGIYRAHKVAERNCGCLPEHFRRSPDQPYLLHLKGPRRKGAMLSMAKRLKLEAPSVP